MTTILFSIGCLNSTGEKGRGINRVECVCCIIALIFNPC